jgi:Holliday junction resolvase RusA-like endonuclease
MADVVEFRIDGPMMTKGTAAWSERAAALVRESQRRLSETVSGSDQVSELRGWLLANKRLGLKVEFHLSSLRVAKSDLDNLLNAIFNTLVEAAGFTRPSRKPIPQTKDALFWRVEAEKVCDEHEHTLVTVYLL